MTKHGKIVALQQRADELHDELIDLRRRMTSMTGSRDMWRALAVVLAVAHVLVLAAVIRISNGS